MNCNIINQQFIMDSDKEHKMNDKLDVEAQVNLRFSGTVDNPESKKQLIEQNSLKDEGGKQNLKLSDYNAFLLKSSQQSRTDYPSNFKLIKINEISDSEIKQKAKWEISALGCTRQQLIDVSTQIIMENKFAEHKLNKQEVRGLITAIALNYNTVSYHNFCHGFSLMQMLYKCMQEDDSLNSIYSQEQLAYYYIAGVAHDVNHPGTNNGYEIKLNTQLASMAGNDAVLQKMHVRTFLSILKTKPQYDVLTKSTNPYQVKQKITRAILATDMAKHAKKIQHLQKLHADKVNFREEQNKTVLMQNLIHACDISNGLLPLDQSLSWGALLSYEFNEQTKAEALHNVPITGFLKYSTLSAFYDDQIGFLSKFVLPLWKQIGNIFPLLDPIIKNGEKNMQSIKELKSTYKQ